MKSLSLKDLNEFVEKNIGTFHKKRIASLDTLKLTQVLLRKNPYLFKAKYVLTAEEVIKTLVDAHISSSEEGIFGEFLETLAIFVSNKIYGGTKSSAEGIDLEFERENIRYIVAIKSGPNWANSSQINKMKESFKKAKRILGTNALKINIVAVNGCCYGRDNQPDKGDYLKLCGQRFWEFISGNNDFYTQIVEPVGHQAKEKNDNYLQSYAQMVNKFTFEFAINFCDDGIINWEKIVKFNSATEKYNPQKIKT
jgi:hypothetical protein